MKYEFKDNEIITVHTEAKQAMDQVRAETAVDMDVRKFIELEKKKFKKTDELRDMINRE